MRFKPALCLTAATLALGAAGFGASALAQTIYYTQPVYTEPVAPYPGERIYVESIARTSGSLHGGAVTADDEVLLANALSALASARDMNGSTVTVVAKNGELIMSGLATNAAQAARIKAIAKNAASGHVTAMIDTSGS